MSDLVSDAENALNMRALKGSGVYTNKTGEGFSNNLPALNKIIDKLMKYTKILDENKIYATITEFESYITRNSSIQTSELFEVLKYF